MIDKKTNFAGNKRVSKAFADAPRLLINNSSRIIIASDCHRGTGDQDDNFADNENNYYTAMSQYFNQGYTYIELGDGDELWENRKFSLITDRNRRIFRLLSKFRCENRLHMIYGNHDIVKKNVKWRKNNLSGYYDERTKCKLPLFGGLEITEGIILSHRETGRNLYLLHGHQGDMLNDSLWRAARFLVRHVWRPLELIGVKDPTSTAENRKKNHMIEERLSGWAKQNDSVLIAGHTHRPVFPNHGEPLYFNDGSCVHPRCITMLEITDGTISLVKWGVETKPDGVLFVGKTVLEGPVRLERLFEPAPDSKSRFNECLHEF